MADIICSQPWHCGNRDGCQQGWHLSNYWIYDDGTFSVDNYADGYHECCDEEDVPGAKALDDAWREYHRYVAETGLDPLQEFIIPSPVKKSRQWQARLRTWIGIGQRGPRIIGLRKRGRGPWRTVRDVPAAVLEYLNATVQHPCLHDFPGTTDEAFTAVSQADGVEKAVRSGRELRIWFHVDEASHWSDDRISQWLKRAARRALRNKS